MNQVITSYDDLVSTDMVQWCFETVMRWIYSCDELRQMNAAGNAVKLFKQKYPKEKTRHQKLYRIYWKLRRELNQI